MFRFYYLFIFILSFYISIYSSPPSGSGYIGSHYEINKLQANQYPPYSLSMPFDVLISYIAMDTISHYGDYSTTRNFIKRQSLTNDSMKRIIKHYYSVKDYDPIKYFISSNYSDTTHSLNFSWINKDLDAQILSLDNDSLGFSPILNSDYILHIRVTDTIPFIDSISYGASRLFYNVYFDVIDTVKGKVFPNCNNNNQVSNKNDKSNKIQTSNCLNFVYCPFWKRKVEGSQEKSLYQDNGKPWIEKDKEYIVFFNIIRVKNEQDKFHYVLRSISPESAVFRMFPIDANGNVYNPKNEFGIPNNSTVSSFKQNLVNRINSILGN
jgi:hypothetical protein